MTEKEYEETLDYISLHFDDDPLPDDFMEKVISVENYEATYYPIKD